MFKRVAGALALLAALSLAAGTAAAGSRAHKSARSDVREAPLKDCTRFNGRYGYYGNPWCSAREQAAWDRWSAGRRWVR